MSRRHWVALTRSLATAADAQSLREIGYLIFLRPKTMPHDFLSMTQLVERLGRDRREVEKMVSRGRIPGHKVEGEWRFHPAKITHWLEQEIRGYSNEELVAVEASQGTT